MRQIFSFLIDDVAEHPLKAEMLMLSLIDHAHVAAKDIFLHCTTRVKPEIIAYFGKTLPHVFVVEPYLDEKYCNKLQQLPSILSCGQQDITGIYLLDVDMVALAPIQVPNPDAIGGKIVDAGNPPFADLESIFARLDMAMPEVVAVDWNDAQTIDGNFNGGFLYVPYALAQELAARWRHYATFLFSNPDVFIHPQARTHIDQISFALALAQGGLAYERLPTNYNYPLNGQGQAIYLQPEKDIFVLHYHNLMDDYGNVLAGAHGRDHARTCNEWMARYPDALMGFDGFKKSQAAKKLSALPEIENVAGMDALKALFDRTRLPKRCILHVGTPKTGTTSLQFFLDQNREACAEAGLCYPVPPFGGGDEPKHQFLVECLYRRDYGKLAAGLAEMFAQVPTSCQTLLLSTEGIYNHWRDYSPEARAVLRYICERMQMEVCGWFRDPIDFMCSLYIQNLKNPHSEVTACFGRNISLLEMMDDDWFAHHADYLGFVCEMEALIGRPMQLFAYDRAVIDTFAAYVGIDISGFKPLMRNQNVTPSRFTIAIIRRINDIAMSAPQKQSAVEWLLKLDRLAARFSPKFTADEAEKLRIHCVSQRGWNLLQQRLVKR